jgi:hypothetical protein
VKVKDMMTDDYWMRKREINRSCSMTWWGQLRDTYNALKLCRPQVWNTESHCPEVFDVAKMDFVLFHFKCHERPLLTGTLYYNYWNEIQGGNVVKTLDVRAGFYGREGYKASSTHSVLKAVHGKWFLNHNDAGLKEPLINYIKRRFK